MLLFLPSSKSKFHDRQTVAYDARQAHLGAVCRIAAAMGERALADAGKISGIDFVDRVDIAAIFAGFTVAAYELAGLANLPARPAISLCTDPREQRSR